VLIIDATTHGIVGGFPVGFAPMDIAVNPVTNRIYVTNGSGGAVLVIDGASNGILTAVPVGQYAYRVAVNPNTNRIYISGYEANAVAVIDGAANSLVATIPTGTWSRAVAVNPTTNRVYVGTIGSVSVIDGNTSSIVDTVAFGTTREALAVNPLTNRIYVTGEPLVTASHRTGYVFVIDARTHRIVTATPVGTSPVGIAVVPAESRVYVSSAQSNVVSRFRDTFKGAITFPDVSITQIDSPDPVPVGADVTTRIAVTNLGTAPATDVTAIHTSFRRAFVIVVSATPTKGTCLLLGRTAECALGTLNPGETVHITVVAAPLSDQLFRTTTSVAANEPDINPANNAAAEETFVIPVTVASLCNLTRYFISEHDGQHLGSGRGEREERAVADSLCAKLEAARAAAARGDASAKASALTGYTNDVSAQIGRLLTADRAATLVNLAGTL